MLVDEPVDLDLDCRLNTLIHGLTTRVYLKSATVWRKVAIDCHLTHHHHLYYYYCSPTAISPSSML